jgi:hypothetical protein
MWSKLWIVPETDEQVDPISYAPSVAKEIENEYGKTALEGLQKIDFSDQSTGMSDKKRSGGRVSYGGRNDATGTGLPISNVRFHGGYEGRADVPRISRKRRS